MKPSALVLAGPTASGKTALALELARTLPVEAVNADGLQVFRRLDIGTAKPTRGELADTPYHLLDVLDPDQPATAAWYAAQAMTVLEDIRKRGKLPVIVGGAGFYLRALERPPVTLPAGSQTTGDEDHSWLRERDPEAAAKIHPNDRYRIGRAVSLIRQGLKPSDVFRAAGEQEPRATLHWIGIDLARAELHARINERVVEMFRRGLVEETHSVLKEFPAARARLERTIGYREALEFLGGRLSETRAVEVAQQATRQYAKRQVTWFRKERRIEWCAEGAVFDKARRIVENVLHA